MKNSTQKESLFPLHDKPWIWALAIFILAAAARFFSGAGLFLADIDPGYRNFEIFDSSYQMRRTEMIIENYPSVPFHDTYHYYPDNPTIPWPPGYNFLIASLAKPFTLFFPSRLFRETFVGVLPCLFDALSVVCFFFFFRRLAPPGSAALAGLMLALSTINITFSEAGYIDHHYFMTFFIALSCLALGKFHDNPSPKQAVLLGLLLGSGPFFNVSLIQFILLFLFCVGVLGWLRRAEADIRRAVALVFGGALLASFLSAFSTPVGRAGSLVYDQTSLFQFGMILLLAAAFFLFFIWTAPLVKKPAAKWAVTLGTAGLMAFLGILAIPQAKEGARFLLAGNLLNYIQGEEQPIASYFPTWPLIFTWLVFFFPFGLRPLLSQWKERPLLTLLAGLLLAYGLFTGLSHFLYLQFLFPWYALVVSLGVHWVMEKMKKPFGFFRYAALIPFLVQMSLTGWNKAFAKDPAEISERDSIRQTIQAFQWMRENTPPTSHHARGDGKPEYSVWAFRDHGHQIARIAERPAVVSPFSTPEFVDHMKDYARFAFKKKESEVTRLLDGYDARYLVLDHRNYSLRNFLLHLLKDEPGFARYEQDSNDLPFLFCNNLLLFDGELRWRKTPGVRHFRLVYEVEKKVSVPLRSNGKGFNHYFNGLKIFERVPGAILSGSGFNPGERVIVKLPLKTNTGREWAYTNFSEADSSGRVSVTVPYPTEPSPHSAVLPQASEYEIMGRSGRIRKTRVSAEAVMEGKTLSF